MTNNYAIIFVGLPGIGKTTISKELVKCLDNIVHIEIDQFYDSGKSNNNAYLHAIENTVKTYNVVLCKNHHTKESLDEVIDIMKRNEINYYIFNLIPENFQLQTREEQNIIVNVLLDRIEKRNDNISPLKIDSDNSRLKAQRIIIHAFIKKYCIPDNCIYLDYNANIIDNIMKIKQVIL